MKKAIYIVGATAAMVFFCGIVLFILGEWGALVEYHASEWRVFNSRELVRSHAQL